MYVIEVGEKERRRRVSSGSLLLGGVISHTRGLFVLLMLYI